VLLLYTNGRMRGRWARRAIHAGRENGERLFDLDFGGGFDSLAFRRRRGVGDAGGR
jgi:hypothetical protein